MTQSCQFSFSILRPRSGHVFELRFTIDCCREKAQEDGGQRAEDRKRRAENGGRRTGDGGRRAGYWPYLRSRLDFFGFEFLVLEPDPRLRGDKVFSGGNFVEENYGCRYSVGQKKYAALAGLIMLFFSPDLRH